MLSILCTSNTRLMKLGLLTGSSNGLTVDLTTPGNSLSFLWDLYLRVKPTSIVSSLDAFGTSSSSAELQVNKKMMQDNNTKSTALRFIKHFIKLYVFIKKVSSCLVHQASHSNGTSGAPLIITVALINSLLNYEAV